MPAATGTNSWKNCFDSELLIRWARLPAAHIINIRVV